MMRSLSIIGLMAACIVMSTCSLVHAQRVSLYYFTAEDIASASGTANHPVKRVMEGASKERVMDATLRALFDGPTEEEMLAGAHTTDDLAALGDFYEGVTMVDTSAQVAFRHDALTILNAAAARQGMAKAPIEKTLLQFPGVENVEYMIDGKVFDQWDA